MPDSIKRDAANELVAATELLKQQAVAGTADQQRRVGAVAAGSEVGSQVIDLHGHIHQLGLRQDAAELLVALLGDKVQISDLVDYTRDELLSDIESEPSRGLSPEQKALAFIDIIRRLEAHKLKLESPADYAESIKAFTASMSDTVSVKTYNILARAGIQTVGELCDFTEKELRIFHTLGRRSIDEVVKGLHNRKLMLCPEELRRAGLELDDRSLHILDTQRRMASEERTRRLAQRR